MKILIPTLYSNTRGGSVKILLASADILEKKYIVNVRANIDEADQRTKYELPDTVDTKAKKLRIIFALLKIIALEIVHLRKEKIDIIYVHDELTLYTYGVIGKILNCKIVWHIHAREGDGLKWSFRNWLSNYKIYISGHTKKRNEKNSFILYNPLLFEEAQHINTGRDDNTLNISIIGSISDNKNQLYGLEIIRQYIKEKPNKKIILNIFGGHSDEVYYNRLTQYIKTNKLENSIRFFGYAKKEEIYANTDIVLCTSKYESFGLVIIEAIFHGIPVVANNLDAVNEIFDLVDYDKSLVFQNAGEACEAIDSALRKDMRPYINNVTRIFSYDKFSKGLLNIFAEIEKNEN